MRSVKPVQNDPALDELRARVEAVVADGKVSYKALAESARMSQQTLKALREGRYATVRSGTLSGLLTALSLIEGGNEGLNPHIATVVAQARVEMHEFLVRYAVLVTEAASRPADEIPTRAPDDADPHRDAVASNDGELSTRLTAATAGSRGDPSTTDDADRGRRLKKRKEADAVAQRTRQAR